jgi:hypothetical protein
MIVFGDDMRLLQRQGRRRKIGSCRPDRQVGVNPVSQQSTRKLVSLVAAGAILVLARWLDTVVLGGIRQTANSTFDVLPASWAFSFGYLLVAGAVLMVAMLGRWARSSVVGVVYALVGALLVFVGPLIWLGAAGLNGAPPFLPGPLATLVDKIYLSGEQGALNAVAIIGAAMLLVGLASIGSALRHRVPPVPGPVDTSLQPEPSPR